MASMNARRPSRKGCPNHPFEFKRRLAAQACDPNVSVAKLAREHGVNTNLLFRWRRQYRQGLFGVLDANCANSPTTCVSSAAKPATDVLTLLPVETTLPTTMAATIEVLFASATVRICGTPDTTTLRFVLDTLARRV